MPKPNAYTMFLKEKVTEYNRNLRGGEQKMILTPEMFTDPLFSDEWTAKSAEERAKYKEKADKANGKVKAPSKAQQSDAPKVKVEARPSQEAVPVQNHNWDFQVPRIIVGIGHGGGIPQDLILHGSGGLLSRGRGRGLGHGRSMRMCQDYDHQFKFEEVEEPEDVKPEVGWGMQANPPVKFEPEEEEPEDVKPEVGSRIQAYPAGYRPSNTYHF